MNVDDSEAKVVLRTIGHEILLFTGDSISRVLPITKEENRYKIEFENNFQIDPFDLASIVDTIFKESHFTNKYRVEVENCLGNLVKHSYELNDTINPGQIACRGRVLPLGCYSVFITFLDTLSVQKSISSTLIEKPIIKPSKSNQNKVTIAIILGIPLILFISMFVYFRRKRNDSKVDSGIIPIGKFNFDKRNQTLQHISTKIDLSSKETDLLYLLYSSENIVLKREEILNAVWGDEGDYIGRTLDVFISKLRKKLASDSRLKIVTVHGVGYKFVIND